MKSNLDLEEEDLVLLSEVGRKASATLLHLQSTCIYARFRERCGSAGAPQHNPLSIRDFLLL